MRVLSFLLICLIVSFIAPPARAQTIKVIPPSGLDKRSPEEIARAFLVAMVLRDADAISQLILPNPEAELLWKDKPLPIELRARARDAAESTPLRRLKTGDVVALPDGQRYTVKKDLVTDTRVLIMPEGFKLPLVVEQDDVDQWKVNAEALIAERKKISEQEKDRSPKKPAEPKKDNR
jgi:hypothetical protein